MAEEKKIKFELTEEETKLIFDLLDLALKAGGLSNKSVVDRLFRVFTTPIPEPKNKESESAKK